MSSKNLLIAMIKDYVKIGDPIDPAVTIGPLANPTAVKTLMRQVSKSIKKGAKVAYGELNYKIEDEKLKNGHFYHPLVIEEIP